MVFMIADLFLMVFMMVDLFCIVFMILGLCHFRMVLIIVDLF